MTDDTPAACVGCRMFRRAAPDDTDGTCRARPPVVVVIKSATVLSAWPKVATDDWCAGYAAKA